MNRTTVLATVILSIYAAACGPSPDTTDAGPDAAPDARMVDALADAPTTDVVDAGATPTPEGAPGGDASPEAGGSSCLPLGGACAPGAGTCYCSLGSGCQWDDVTCPDAGPYAGTCTADPGAIFLDAGDVCCNQCELAWQSDGGTLAGFMACSAGCGAAQCPVRCLAE